MKTMILKHGWQLLQMEPQQKLDIAKVKEAKEWLAIAQMPSQVQDVLLAHKKIPEEFLVGWCQDVNWMTEYDWVYAAKFTRDDADKNRKARLVCKGLDTYADVYLNGTLIIQHSNFYIPAEADVTALLEEENELYIHFHRISDILEAKEFPKAWKGNIQQIKVIRKPVHDFDPHNEWGAEYQGAVPYFQATGVYRDISVEYWSENEIADIDVKAYADVNGDGFVDLRVNGVCNTGNIRIRYTVTDREGEIAAAGFIMPEIAAERWSARSGISVPKPQLWYPHGYGEPYLYDLKLELLAENKTAASGCRRIGFKHVEVLSPLEFVINGRRTRIWGGSLDPLQGWTHCFLPERAERMYDMVLNGHFNTLRIWGEGIPYPDEFYDMADEKGILIWQEFFMGYGPVPDTPEYVEEYKKEAAVLIKRLKHHASLLMWCGGNETILGAEVNFQVPYGKNVLLDVFPKLVNELDPGRFYHPTSPYCGEWCDDPRVGDLHTLDRILRYPYAAYPNFVTEHCVTAPPALHSLKKMVKGDLFPEGYTSLVKNDTELIMPRNWIERSSVGSLGQRKSGPYWEFYDADNAEDMVYKFGAAAGQELRNYGEMVRRGSREPAASSLRSKGYVTCKLLDTWPKIYCSTIDFFLEGYIPYYTIARLFSPVMASFQKEDSIRLWLVNDSGKTFRGKVTYGAYNLITERYYIHETCEVEAAHCDAVIAADYAKYHFIPMECVLFARIEDELGNFVYQSVDYLDVERQLKFPDAVVKVEVEGDELVIAADRFIRCVEILGVTDGDDLGWLFSDNYFDLMPGEVRRVRILARDHGEISVKGHYCKSETKVIYHK